MCKHASIEGVVVEVVALVVGHLPKICTSSQLFSRFEVVPLVHLQAEALLFTLLDLTISCAYSTNFSGVIRGQGLR